MKKISYVQLLLRFISHLRRRRFIGQRRVVNSQDNFCCEYFHFVILFCLLSFFLQFETMIKSRTWLSEPRNKRCEFPAIGETFKKIRTVNSKRSIFENKKFPPKLDSFRIEPMIIYCCLNLISILFGRFSANQDESLF